MYRKLFYLMALAVAMLVAGCMPQEQQGSGGYDVTDGVGRKVHLAGPPQRIYAATTNLEDLVLALVGPERVLAVSADAVGEESLCREEASKVKEVFTTPPSVEKLLALRPDLVIIQEREADVTKTYEASGLNVFVLPLATNRELVEQRIGLVAAAVGERERGAQLIEDMRAKLARVAARLKAIPESERPIGIAYSVHGAFGSKQGLMHSILTDAGLRNGAAIAGLKRQDHLSKEAIIAVRPDYFILPTRSVVVRLEGSADDLAAQLASDRAFVGLPAVQAGHIIRIPDRYRYCNSHHYADGVVLLHEKVYGPLP